VLELSVLGKYQMNWASLRSGTRVNFQKSSILRNAGESVIDLGHDSIYRPGLILIPHTAASTTTTYPLYAITPEIAKYLR
jgi:hypothetical protein